MKALLRLLLLLLPLLPAATGCDHRDLCYDHRHYVPVSLEFDWSEAPEAAPESMVVWFFPADGSQGQIRAFPGRRQHPEQLRRADKSASRCLPRAVS